MACTLNKGRLEPCKDSVGGIQAVYFVDFGTLGDATYSSQSDEITAFSGTPTAYKYVVKGNSSLEQTITSSRENGTTFYDQITNLTFKKLSPQSHDELALIAVARPHVIVEDNNGNAFITGLEFGSDVNGGTIVTGAAMGDLSGYTLTLQGMEKKPANFLSGGVTGVGITVSTDEIDDI
tara:strand:- start:3468 stop:4004 length:537 start_codon:yes stop_codon:yes gene_type:complete